MSEVAEILQSARLLDAGFVHGFPTRRGGISEGPFASLSFSRTKEPAAHVEENLRRQTRLHITGQHEFGLHYAQTLQIWQARFDAAAGRLSGLGFDEVFRRMWRLYLSYSEAGFRSRYLQVSQFILSRDDGSPA